MRGGGLGRQDGRKRRCIGGGGAAIAWFAFWTSAQQHLQSVFHAVESVSLKDVIRNRLVPRDSVEIPPKSVPPCDKLP